MDPKIAMKVETVARQQHRVIRHDQAVRCGVSASTIARLVRQRLWRRIGRGVYLTGGEVESWPRARDGGGARRRAGAVLSHDSAAHLWKLPGSPRPTRLEVLVEAVKPRVVPGVVVHCTRSLDDLDMTRCERVPVTTVTRTIRDLASRRTVEELGDLITDGARRRLTTPAALTACAWRVIDRRGRARLLEAIGAFDVQLARAGSKFEVRLRNALVLRGVDAPMMNPELTIAGRSRRPDLAWLTEKVAVEAHGPHHERPSQLRLDAERDAEFTTDGWVVIYVLEEELDEDPDLLASEIAALLQRRRQQSA